MAPQCTMPLHFNVPQHTCGALLCAAPKKHAGPYFSVVVHSQLNLNGSFRSQIICMFSKVILKNTF